MVGEIKINNLEVFGFHGCMEEESIIGTRFTVNATIRYNLAKAALSDDLQHAVDYGQVSEIIKREVKQRNNLVETVIVRIVNKLKSEIQGIEWLRVELTKHAPPINANVESISLVLESD
ncbi:dihydroneopterin aldolase [Luteibaculum oceani]|uniref:7,8-dihydroneopterin aldolase n=1 Tax=Luteibaculum oceani TaxID=1294296 RepID=A0A5C6VK55_9FLAO|nr:dihydroneopterin aldolase [Luteibaculum oceani]TXC85369.1 dihydroneopterin aldolase [Luteibaculum oceani]